MSPKNSSNSTTDVQKSIREKDYKIKELKEEVLKLKVRIQDDSNMAMSISNMEVLRQDFRMADDFVRAIIKDNISNYDIIIQMEEEVKKNKTTNTHKMVPIKNQQSDIINNDTCKCSSCIMQKSMSKTMFSNSTSWFNKIIQISHNVFMQMSFDCSEYQISSAMDSENVKKMELFSKKSNRKKMSLEFYQKQKELNTHYDFSMHNNLNLGIQVNINEENYMVSYSSFMVVKAMRETWENPLNSLVLRNKMQNMDELRLKCFSIMLKVITDGMIYRDDIYSINDLHDEEEMLLLTNFGNKVVYVFFDEKENMNMDNHISSSKFNNSVEIQVYKLVTPLLRSVCFFAEFMIDEPIEVPDNESDFDIISVLNENPKLDEEHKDKNIWGEKKILSDKDTDSVSSRNKSIADDVNDDHDDFEEISEIYDHNMTKVLKKNNGVITNPFFIEAFMKKNTNKGIDNAMLSKLTASTLAFNFIDGINHPDIKALHLFSMKETYFRALLVFHRNTRDFTSSVYEDSFELWWQKSTMLTKMFYEHYIKKFNLESLENTQEMLFTNFLEDMWSELHIDDKFLSRLFLDFKSRINMYIKMRTEAVDIDYTLNGSMSSMMYSESSTENKSSTFMNFLTIRDNMMNDNMKVISKFQPTKDLKFHLKYGNYMVDFESIVKSNKMSNFFVYKEQHEKIN